MSTSSLPQSTTVLIVGAGPTGLAAAISLLHHGIRDVVLVDAVRQGMNASRAGVLHAATIEALEKIDAAKGILARGIKLKDVYLRTRTWDLVHASFDLLNGLTSHPYSVFLPQNITETILAEQLQEMGITVHRPYKVIGLRQNAANARVTDVLFEDGQVVSAKYVIGADGARSSVRAAAGIGFADPDPEGEKKEHRLTQMVLADVTFDREPDMKGLFNGVMSPDSWFIVVNWTEKFNDSLSPPGERIEKPLYRIGCGIPVRNGVPPSSPPKEYMQKALNAYGPTFLSSDPAVNRKPVEVDRVVWSTRFRISCAIADRTFTRLGSSGEGGIVLLVGDAAHIHSPAGGQGMNLGLRDAVFLGEALEAHIRTSESTTNCKMEEIDAVLRAYAETRRIRALGVIQFTNKFLQFVSMPYSSRWWMPVSFGLVRDIFVRYCGRFTFWQSKVALGLSGLERV